MSEHRAGPEEGLSESVALAVHSSRVRLVAVPDDHAAIQLAVRAAVKIRALAFDYDDECAFDWGL